MNKKKTWLLMATSAVLVACSNVLDQAKKSSEDIVETKEAIIIALNAIQQKEMAVQAQFDEALTFDEDLTNFTNKDANIFENVSERKEELNKIEDQVAELKQQVSDLTGLSDSELPVEEIKNVSDAAESFVTTIESYLPAYQEQLQIEEETYQSFGEVDATFETFYQGVNKLNELSGDSMTILTPLSEFSLDLDEQLSQLLDALSSDQENRDKVQADVDSSIEGAEEESVNESSTVESAEEIVQAYEYQINPDLFTVEPVADADSDVVLLTFDDAPQPPDSKTLTIAQTLNDKGAKAIFFVMGQFLESEDARTILKEVYDMGFEIGNHSYTHADLASLSYEEQLEEISKTNDLIEEITGERPRFVRPPYGSYNSDTDLIAEAEQMTLMNWTYGYDWVDGYMDEVALADIMVNAPELGCGGNLLMHDRPWTAGAIGNIVDGLRNQGYEIVDPALLASPEEE